MSSTIFSFVNFIQLQDKYFYVESKLRRIIRNKLIHHKHRSEENSWLPRARKACSTFPIMPTSWRIIGRTHTQFSLYIKFESLQGDINIYTLSFKCIKSFDEQLTLTHSVCIFFREFQTLFNFLILFKIFSYKYIFNKKKLKRQMEINFFRLKFFYP